MLKRHPEAWAVFAALLVCYGLTVPADVSWGDSGELAAACYRLGIAHPPGYPLYTVLGFVWTHVLPIGEVALRLNLLSALCAAAAGGVLCLALQRLLAQIGFREQTDRRRAAAVATLMAGTTSLVWSQAVITEVYALLMLLMALALWSFARALDTGRWTAAVGWLMLALTHHPLAIGLLPGMLAWAWWRQGTAPLKQLRQQCGRCAAAAGAGLLPLSYLPLRAASDPAVNWGDPATLARWWAHIRAAAYAHAFQPAQPLFVQPGFAGQWLAEVGWQYHWLWLFALAGLVACAQVNVRTFAGVLLFPLASFYLGSCHYVGDWWVFLLPAVWLVSLWLACGVAWLLWIARDYPVRLRYWLLLLALLGPVTQISIALPGQLAARDATASHYGTTMLACLPTDSALLLGLWYPGADYEINAVMYARHCLGCRPDVQVIQANFLRYPWYGARLQARGIPWYGAGRLLDDRTYFHKLARQVVDPLLKIHPICSTQALAGLKGRRWSGGVVRMAPATVARYRYRELCRVPVSSRGVDPRLAGRLPAGTVYQWEAAR